MNGKSNINIFKIIWVSGVFLLLITILLMVMDYKINYQYLTKNNLYFYDCNNSICTAQVKDGISESNLYSVYECGYEVCPVIKKVIGESYVILTSDNLNILYNFLEGKVISNSYENYNLINDKYFIVTLNGYQGLIDLDNNILIGTVYEQLGYMENDILVGYNFQNIIAKKNNLYGIISIKEEKIVEKIEYSENDIKRLLEIINS